MEFLESQNQKIKIKFTQVFANGRIVLAPKNIMSVNQPFNLLEKQEYQTTALTEQINQPLMTIAMQNSMQQQIANQADKNQTMVPHIEPDSSHYQVMMSMQSDTVESLITETYTVEGDYVKSDSTVNSDNSDNSDNLSSLDTAPTQDMTIVVEQAEQNYETQFVSVVGDNVVVNSIPVEKVEESNQMVDAVEIVEDATTTDMPVDENIIKDNEVVIAHDTTTDVAESEIIVDDNEKNNNVTISAENDVETLEQSMTDVHDTINETVAITHDDSTDIVEKTATVSDNIEQDSEKNIDSVVSNHSDEVIEHTVDVNNHHVDTIDEVAIANYHTTEVVKEVIRDNKSETIEKMAADIQQNNTSLMTNMVPLSKTKIALEKETKNLKEHGHSQSIKKSPAIGKKKTKKSKEKVKKQTISQQVKETDSVPMAKNQLEQNVSTIVPKNPLHTCYKVGGILLAFAVLNIWVMQRSVNAYYLQTYHQPSPLVKLDDFALWSAGAKIGDFLYARHDALTSSIQQANQQVVDNFNQNHAFTAEYLAEQEQKRQAQLAQLKLEQEKQAKEQLAQRYVLTPNDKIFFAGDSMMQGVAPHVQQYLQKHNIQSINLSKQSTGLSYPSFFDWPKTIEQTLQQNPDIKILAVFLGPNDPWNMVHPQTKQLLKFASLEWQTEYQSRMLRILNAAKQHQVSVIWLTSPNMKDDKLNRQMIDLNKIINDELSRHDDVLAIDTRALLGSQNDVYNDYLVKDGQSIKMRTGDGVHFTPQGQKNVAQALQQHLTIMP